MNATTENKATAPNAEDAAKAALLKLYSAPAQAIGKAVQKIETARGGLWKAGILAGLKIAHANGHNADTFHMGMALAAEDQEIPRGSWSSYLATAKNLLTDVYAGKISLEAVMLLSIQDARKRYAKPKASTTGNTAQPQEEGAEAISTENSSASRRALLTALNKAITRITDEQLADLVMLAEAQAAENAEPEEEGEAEETGEAVKKAA